MVIWLHYISTKTLRMPFNGSNMIQLADCVKYSTPDYKYIPEYKNEYKSILVKMLQKSSYARCDINFIYNNKFIRSLLSEEKAVPVNNKVNNNFKIIYQLVNIRNWKNIITELNSKITETVVNYSKIKILILLKIIVSLTYSEM